MTPRGGTSRFKIASNVDHIGDAVIRDGETIIIHWPEQEESRIVSVESEERAFITLDRYGATFRVYLREIASQVSIQRPAR